MPPLQFFRELFEIRWMIEPQAVALAAERATAEDLAEIRQAYADMAAADPAGDTAIDADLRFHRGILAAGHNDLLLQMGNLIGVGLLISYRISSDTFTVFLPQHKAVLDAIADRRPSEGRRAMERLLAETRAFLERQMAGSMEYAAS
jgi:DNA-binding FadR family transcriptional regulator